MNERIRKLLNKLLNEATSGLEPDLSEQRTVTLNEMEKFAELIVRECMQVVHNGINNATDWDSSSWDQCCENRMYAIQKHFGVEQ